MEFFKQETFIYISSYVFDLCMISSVLPIKKKFIRSKNPVSLPTYMQITKCFIMIYLFLFHISMSLLHAVDCGFESRSGQTKDYEIGMCCFSAKHASLRRKSNGSESG